MTHKYTFNNIDSIPSIAIVGRPNVGKSTLFNRIVGKRIAIEHSEPGVTRDRIVEYCYQYDKPFMLIDTGGLLCFRNENLDNRTDAMVIKQLELAIETANVVILVLDVTTGLLPLDEEMAALLREKSKPVYVAANKADNPDLENDVSELLTLGFTRITPISCLHNRNSGRRSFLPETGNFPCRTAGHRFGT